MNKLGKFFMVFAVFTMFYVFNAEILIGKYVARDWASNENMTCGTNGISADDQITCECHRQVVYKNRYIIAYKLPYWSMLNILNLDSTRKNDTVLFNARTLPYFATCMKDQKQEYINNFFKKQ